MTSGCQFLDPHLTTYHPNIGVHIIVVFDLGMSTLDNQREMHHILL